MFYTLNLKRLRQISHVLFRHGFMRVLSNIGFLKYLPLHKRIKGVQEKSVSPIDIREIFEELGGAFLKLGQLLALRPDLIGKDYAKELEKLLNHIDPVPFEKLKDNIKHINFEFIDKKPLGTASIAQVHKAKIDGHDVAVKIKKPFVDEMFKEDIKIMEFFAKEIEKHYDLSFVSLSEIVIEFKSYTKKELDLSHEARNIQRFYKNFHNYENVKIPKVYDEYSTKDVVVMQYLEGNNILDVKIKNGHQVIRIITDAVYKMIFEDRFFHADLHPGNIFIHNNKIIFLDFGIVGRIDEELEKKLFSLFSALVEPNLEKTAESLLDLHIGNEDVDEEYLKRGIEDTLGDYYDHSLKDLNFEEIFYNSIEVARKSGIKMPAHLVLFGKSLVTMDGFCREIDPDFNVIQNAKPYVRKILQSKLSYTNLKKETKNAALQMYSGLSKFPQYTKNFSRKFDILEKQVTGIDNNIKYFNKTFRQMSKLLSVTFIFATFFISSVLLVDFGPQLLGYPLFSAVLFIISMYFFVRLLGYSKE